LSPAETLRQHGIKGHFVDGKVIRHESVSAHYADLLHIVVCEQDEIDIDGRDAGSPTRVLREVIVDSIL